MRLLNMKRTLSAAAGLIAVLMLVACSGGAESAGNGDTSELTFAYNAQPSSLDPHVSTANATADIMRNVFEPLVALDLKNNPQPVLAESVEYNKDYSEMTFTLRDVSFHDGSELDSGDVVASLERWMSFSLAGSLFKDVELEAVDERTVKLSSSRPSFGMTALLADPVQFPAIMPSEVLERLETDGVLTEFIGTGPYKFEEWKTDQYVHLSKNGEYESPTGGTDGLGGERTPTFENIYYNFVSDDNTRISGLQTGEYDVANKIPTDNVEQIKANEKLRVQTAGSGMVGMVFNKAEGKMMNDKNLRHAVLVALDMNAVLAGAYASDEYYDVDGALGLPAQELWYDGEGHEEYNANDTALSDEYKKKSGYDGELIRLITTRDYAYMYDAAVIVEQELKDAGFNVRLDVYDWATVLSKSADPSQYEMYVSAWTPTSIPTKYTFMGKQGQGSTNDPELFDATGAVNFSDSPESAAEAMAKLQAVFYDYLPMIKFGNHTTTSAVSTEFDGYFYQEGAGDIVFNMKPKK